MIALREKKKKSSLKFLEVSIIYFGSYNVCWGHLERVIHYTKPFVERERKG